MNPAESHSNLNTVLARGIGILASEDFGAWARQAADSSNPAYRMAVEYIVPERFMRAPAWARRARQGELYGKKYIGPYRDFLRQLFDTGKNDESRKMNGDQMFEALAKEHPLVYTLPSTAEIDAFIGQCFLADKSNQDRDQEPEPEHQEQLTQATPVQDKYIKEITSVLERCDGIILPRFVANRLASVFQHDEGFTIRGRDKDSSVPNEVANLIKAVRLHIQKQKKKLLIG
jgi:hypothetical protein